MHFIELLWIKMLVLDWNEENKELGYIYRDKIYD